MAYDGYNGLKILVVDDFDSFRATVCRMLRMLGIEQIDTALNGVQAIEACRARDYDLILCDYNLGTGKNGQQVLEELRVNKLVKRCNLFVLISAETSTNMIMATYDYEPDAYLIKPFTGKTLEQRLERLLKQRDELTPVYNAMHDSDTEEAISLCRQAIAEDSRYTSLYQKLLGNLYLQAEAYDLAGKLYRQVLETRTLDWAQVGLAKVKQAQGDAETANMWLRKIIDGNPMCMPAYDALAINCAQQDDSYQLQDILQRAANISPMSIARQQHLAQAAQANNDFATAATAYRRTVRLGQYSCRDCVENHLTFGRVTAALFKDDDKLAYSFSRDSLRILAEIPQHFVIAQEEEIQSHLIECQLYAGQGSKQKAGEVLQKTEVQLNQSQPVCCVDTELDYVLALQAVGKHTQAKGLLDQIVERYRDDELALKKIDPLLEEPLSEHNRQRVAKINRDGISLYDSGQFNQAVDCFEQAVQLFPNHIGVHLNLIQALVGGVDTQGCGEERMATCLSVLKKIECRIYPHHKQYNRYLQLKDKIKSVGLSAEDKSSGEKNTESKKSGDKA